MFAGMPRDPPYIPAAAFAPPIGVLLLLLLGPAPLAPPPALLLLLLLLLRPKLLLLLPLLALSLRAPRAPLPADTGVGRAGLAVAAVAAGVLLLLLTAAVLDPFSGDLRRAAAAGVAPLLLLPCCCAPLQAQTTKGTRSKSTNATVGLCVWLVPYCPEIEHMQSSAVHCRNCSLRQARACLGQSANLMLGTALRSCCGQGW
jgi:hypothetical protein